VLELAPLLQAGVRFVGVMGSARHTAPHLEALRKAGCTDDELSQLRTPVGLDLGARTHEEIAVAVVAELIAVRRTGSSPRPPGSARIPAMPPPLKAGKA
jgi:xanthine dehydrogenase accessory factor